MRVPALALWLWAFGCRYGFEEVASDSATSTDARDAPSITDDVADVAPLCTSLDFEAQVLDGISSQNSMDVLLAASSDGDTILQRNSQAQCGLTSVDILDATAPQSFSYQRRAFDGAALGFGSLDFFALTSDGLTVIGIAPELRRFAATRRSSRALVDFGALDDTAFSQINAAFVMDAAARFGNVVISPDGLALYFTVTAATDPARVGIYESIRGSMTAPFPAAVRMPEVVQQRHTSVTGISADHRALFLDACPDMAAADCWYTEVLSRRSREEPFANPNAPNLPPRILYGGFAWAQIPLGDCARTLAVTSPGGCAGQDISLMTRR